MASKTRYECGLIVSVNVDRGATGSRRRVIAVVGGRAAVTHIETTSHVFKSGNNETVTVVSSGKND